MYAKITNGAVDQFPYTVGDLRRDNPNTSFPRRIPDELMRGYGAYPVHPVPAPDITGRTQRLERKAQPHEEGGQWVIGWNVVEKAAADIEQYDRMAETSARSQRADRLAATDWIIIKAQETGEAMDQVWLDYRQALRDITDHVNFPYLADEDWPVKPV